MFHWVTGTPFHSEMHGGAFDDLTLWEQIDEGAQNTPSKKWLFSVPVGLYVLRLPPFYQVDSLCSFVLLLVRQVPCINALYKLQPVAICREHHRACSRSYP